MKSPITIDFVNATITVNAAYAKKASNPFSAEYAQIQKVRADYPTFTVRTRSIKKNAAKDSYKGLTYDYMRAYIMSHTLKKIIKNIIKSFTFEGFWTNLINRIVGFLNNSRKIGTGSLSGLFYRIAALTIKNPLI